MKIRLALFAVLALTIAGLAAAHRLLAVYLAHHDPIMALVSAGRAPGSGTVVASALSLLLVRFVLFFVLPPAFVLVGVRMLRRLAERRSGRDSRGARS